MFECLDRMLGLLNLVLLGLLLRCVLFSLLECILYTFLMTLEHESHGGIRKTPKYLQSIQIHPLNLKLLVKARKTDSYFKDRKKKNNDVLFILFNDRKKIILLKILLNRWQNKKRIIIYCHLHICDWMCSSCSSFHLVHIFSNLKNQ